MLPTTDFDSNFNPENIRLLAGKGLEWMKKKYSKTSINGADATNEFINFKDTYDRSNDDEGQEYTQLLCLAISIINQTKTINDEIRDKLITNLVKEYAENI